MSYLMNVLSFLDETTEVSSCPYGNGNHDEILSIMYIARTVVRILQIAIPIALIVLGTIDIGKAVIAGDEKKMKEAQKPFVKRIIAAVIVFCIPLLVNIIIGFVSTDEWWSCWKDASNDKYKIDNNSDNDIKNANKY